MTNEIHSGDALIVVDVQNDFCPVCVRATALDARREGFEVLLISGATRPVTPWGGEDARREMRDAGIQEAG